MPIARATKAQKLLRAAAAGRRPEAKARPGRTRGCPATKVGISPAAPGARSVRCASGCKTLANLTSKHGCMHAIGCVDRIARPLQEKTHFVSLGLGAESAQPN